MKEISLWRLYLLRAMYLLAAFGLCIVVIPGVIHHDKPWELMAGIVQCMLTAFWLLCILGLRYPLQMMPILLWELLWKVVWLIIVAVPLWYKGSMDEPTWAKATEILFVVIIPFVIPWDYVFFRYVKQPGNRWRSESPGITTSSITAGERV